MIASRVFFISQLFLAPLGTVAMTKNLVIDSHLHVWASQKEAEAAFPYAEGQVPPESLRDTASKTSLLHMMDSIGRDGRLVDGALIVQPINHKFDHSYVISAIKEYPDRFKAMLLHDPSLSPEQAVDQLEDLAMKGFVGVRFNPYLWPKAGDSSWTPMSTPDGGGLAVYRRCAELKMPVGVMCFQGLQLHYDDIVALLESSPETILILDHFGFTSFTPEGEGAFQKLLKLSEYPQVTVKTSALFRLNDSSPYERVRKERFEPLLATFGADRLMFGSDFPFVTEQDPEKYEGMVKLVASWMDDSKTRDAVMGGTAERLFGPWWAKTA
jgi:predicted TIM-barrel fold metal-dependent hydrolase